MVQHFFGKELTFNFVSDEFDGHNLDPDGSVRTRHERSLTLSQATRENSLSRVYLGVHWKFDGLKDGAPANKIGGVPAGLAIAAEVFSRRFRAVALRAAGAARGKR